MVEEEREGKKRGEARKEEKENREGKSRRVRGDRLTIDV